MKRLTRSFSYAWQGLVYTWRTQPNFRAETIIGLLAVLFAAWLEVNIVPILFLMLAVLSLELINTAIEAVCDLAAPHAHPLAKTAKDTAAAAVLLAAIVSILVGLLLFLPAITDKLRLW